MVKRRIVYLVHYLELGLVISLDSDGKDLRLCDRRVWLSSGVQDVGGARAARFPSDPDRVVDDARFNVGFL